MTKFYYVLSRYPRQSSHTSQVEHVGIFETEELAKDYASLKYGSREELPWETGVGGNAIWAVTQDALWKISPAPKIEWDDVNDVLFGDEPV